MNLTFRQLRVFEAVARHLSYTRAAEDLHLTQPAVSMQVRQLERTVGLPLFNKTGKRISITEAGTEMLRYSRSITRQLTEAEAVFDELKGLKRGRLKITIATTADYFAPQLLAGFNEKYPDIQVVLGIGNRSALLRELANYETELVIMGQPPHDQSLDFTPFRNNPLVIVAPPNHPWVARTQIKLKEIQDSTFLIREPGSGTRIAMKRFFNEQGIQPNTGMEMASNEAIKKGVQAGLGLGLLSKETLAMELELGQLMILDVEAFPIMRLWHVVHREDKHLSHSTRAFKAFLLGDGAS